MEIPPRTSTGEVEGRQTKEKQNYRNDLRIPFMTALCQEFFFGIYRYILHFLFIPPLAPGIWAWGPLA
jgi:hypothetical protein